ncbi:hypothetical protein QYF36_000347 [Acer negundo]|nr:hypothetical protein QYF36_000347 [Acer negundo]
MAKSSSMDIKLEVMEVQSSDIEIKLGEAMTATTDSSPIDIKIGGTPTTNNKKPKMESLWKVDKHPSCSQIYGWIDKEGLSSQIYDCPPNFNSNHQATCAPTAAGGTPSTFTLDSLVGTCSAATGGLSSTLAFGSCLGTCFVSTGGASSRFALGSCAGTYSVDKVVFCCFEGGLEVELESFSIGKCSLKRRCCSHG